MNAKTAWRRRLRARLIKRFGGRCYRCHAREEDCSKLEFHHIKETGVSGRGRGTNVRLRDVRLHPEAYVLLCRGCHLVFHGWSH